MNARGDSHQPVRRFATSLRLAIHDFDHEQSYIKASAGGGAHSGQVVHYWDTDALFWPSFGFLGEEWRDLNPTANHNLGDRLIPALFSSGLLGRVHLLAPHRTEYGNLLAAWGRRPMNRPYESELRSYVTRTGLEPLLESLSQSVSRISGESDREGVRSSLEILRELPANVFSQVESISWPWERRVKRLTGSQALLSLESGGPRTDRILGSRLFSRLVEEISQLRADPRRDIATAVDAAALTALAVMNADSVAGSGGIHPRFYTSSSTLRRLHRDCDWFREALSFHFTTHRGKEVEGTIWRDNYYYLIRVMFPVLSLPGVRRVTLTESKPNLLELRDLSRLLNDALDSGNQTLWRLFTSLRLSNGRTVAQHIEMIESSALAMAWLQHDPDPLVASIVEGVDAVKRLSTIEATRDLTVEFLAGVEGGLRTGVNRLSLETTLLPRVQKAWSGVYHVNRRGTVTLLYDLAAVRWGLRPRRMRGAVELDPVVRNQLERSLLGTHRSQPGDYLLLQDLPALVASVEDVERVSAILVALGQFRLALQLMRLRDADQVGSPSLDLLASYASIRLENSSGLEKAFDDLIVQYASVAPELRPRYCLGYAHAAYWCWRLGNFADFQIAGRASPEEVERRPSDPKGWASEALGMVRKEFPLFSRLQKEFGANHIVRVASEAGIVFEDEQYFLGLLEKYADRTANYRNLDTLGYRAYLRALRAYPRGGRYDAPAFSNWANAFGSEVQLAVSLLREARLLSPKDPQVRDHLERARMLQFELGTVHRG